MFFPWVTVRLALNYGSRERSAIVHIPPQASRTRELAVVINFHGGGGYGGSEQEYSRMDRLADRETFLAVYLLRLDRSRFSL